MMRIRRSRVLVAQQKRHEHAVDAQMLQALAVLETRILRATHTDRWMLSSQMAEEGARIQRSFDNVITESQEYADDLVARHRRLPMWQRIRESLLGW
jgi:hypothetical protein